MPLPATHRSWCGNLDKAVGEILWRFTQAGTFGAIVVA